MYYLLVGLAVGVVMWILWQIIPGSVGDDGSFHVEGTAAVPYVLLTFAAIGFLFGRGFALA
jgi:hypothetical protein